jgi:hypothetical protein
LLKGKVIETDELVISYGQIPTRSKMNSEDLASLYEVQREIGDIFTKMKRDDEMEAKAHSEAGLNLEKSAQMVSQLNDFIEKYGSDTLEESDALAAAVVAEAEYINTLKGKIEEAEHESNTINSAYSHMNFPAEGPDVGEETDINAEIECKTAVMKHLLKTYPSPEHYVEDVSAEYGTYYSHEDGGMVTRWEAAFLIQAASKKKAGENFLFFVNMSSNSSSSDPKERLKTVDASLQSTCELMASEASIGSLPLISFTKRMTIMGARELGSLVANGRAKSGGAESSVKLEKLIPRVKLMVAGEKGDAKLALALKRRGHYFLEMAVEKAEEGGDEEEDDEEEEDLVTFRVVPPS